jgi:phosphopantothenoylcysteine decarboxylase/phosphopantothenate--cysteine ligase
MRLLITAGPTREPIDAVRFIGNRSSGRMGLALAEAARAAGHEVTLLLGPVEVRGDFGDIELHRFETTDELRALLAQHFPACDVLVMAAAVADYRPTQVVPWKMPRESSGKALTLPLQPTPDLVAEVAAARRPQQLIIAFALEAQDQLEQRAADKLARKGVQAIIANPLETMDAPDVTAVVLWADGRRDAPGPMSKGEFARWLIGRITQA